MTDERNWEGDYKKLKSRYDSISEAVTKMSLRAVELEKQNNLVEKRNVQLISTIQQSDTIINQKLSENNRTITEMGVEIQRLRDLIKEQNPL